MSKHKTVKNGCKGLLLLLVVTWMAGCGGNSYRVMERKSEHPTIPLKVMLRAFDEQRDREMESGINVAMIPLFLFGRSHYDRHDEHFSDTEPFPTGFPRLFAAHLNKVGVFESADYFTEKKLPRRGDYDLEIRGVLHVVRSRGSYWRYGLSYLGDVLWYFGFPRIWRKWEVEVSFQLYDAHRKEPLEEPFVAKMKTGSTAYTIYGNRRKANDLLDDIDEIWDQYIDHLWATQPRGDDSRWVQLREKGLILVAQENRGVPPALTILEPRDMAKIRGETTDIRWSATAPEGIRSLQLSMNDTPLPSGLDEKEFDDPKLAPRAIDPQIVTVQLNHLGINRFRLIAEDHRNNREEAELRIHRLPKALQPAVRHGLLIGMDSPVARQGVGELAAVLGNPSYGQFEPQSLQVYTSETLTQADFDESIRKLASQTTAGDLVWIYIAAPGSSAELTLGAKQIPLAPLVQQLQRSIVADNVILMLDIAWDIPSSDWLDRMGDLPVRWAVLGTQSREREGVTLLSRLLCEAMTATDRERSRLTLEKLLDICLDHLPAQDNPVLRGRFDPAITMVERN
jgi:hypothetical protein